MNPSDFKSLIKNKVLKERSRLLILSYLTASETESATFMTLQKALQMTRGNLSVQITTLKDVGFVKVTKAFHGNKPQTTIKVTKDGIFALKDYLSEMEKIISLVQNKNIS